MQNHSQLSLKSGFNIFPLFICVTPRGDTVCKYQQIKLTKQRWT